MLWRNDEVAKKRERMGDTLETLSQMWQEEKLREEEERAKRAAGDDADEDDDVVCEVPVEPKPKPKLKAGRNGARK